RLVPVDAVGADDVVDEPALLLETAHMRLAALVEDGLQGTVHGRFLTYSLNCAARRIAGRSLIRARSSSQQLCRHDLLGVAGVAKHLLADHALGDRGEIIDQGRIDLLELGPQYG